ncbi:hypothetical protein ACRAWC_20905 [Leifsonia sp. L25]|uniref:hypothetical protein n=1 Tax=Leifsonia sp. L25 TaxID=3423957 RepID=UPI003D682EDC
MKRWLSAGMFLSSEPNRNHEGMSRHAGAPDASLSAASRIGRCVTAMAAVTSAGESAANWSWYRLWTM